jgi:hypothetical protein
MERLVGGLTNMLRKRKANLVIFPALLQNKMINRFFLMHPEGL